MNGAALAIFAAAIALAAWQFRREKQGAQQNELAKLARARNVLDKLMRGSVFSLVTQAEQQAGSGQWTADQMGDNTYIFIFVPAGTCLTATGPARLALRHCDLQPDQRWRRAGPAALADNHDFYEYASLSARSCLTVAGRQPGSVWGANLSACSAVAPTSQRLAFYFAAA